MKVIKMFRSVCCALFFLHILATEGYSGQAKPGPGPREYSPEDAILTIRPHTGQSVFQIGETIELDLAFTSTATQKYLVNASTFDRPFSPDHITVAPLSGWDDPLGTFFRFCHTMFEGGLQNIKTLSMKPTIVHLDLNAWVRFKDPGEYQITAESGRVSSRNVGRGKGKVTLSSNRLLLRIVPATPQWQEQTLASALAVLDSTGAAAEDFSQRRARSQAAKILRYLGTLAAAREMAQRIHYADLTYDFLLEARAFSGMFARG